MFELREMKDTIKVPPRLFNVNLNNVVTETLNKKFANKVVHNVGLCIALWDILKIEDSFIFPGDGSSHTVVHFRYIVFRPFMDEVIKGKIRSSGKEGVHVSVGFFDDILIPSDDLQVPSRFDETEQLWVWEYKSGDEKHDLYMDVGEEIRIRIVEEKFVDTTPSRPETGEAAAEIPDSEKKAPYSLIASVSEAGLGLLSWWNT